MPPLFLRLVNFVAIVSIYIIVKSSHAFPLLGIDSGCGGELSSSNGTIKSPGYPQRYPLNKVCVWILRSPGINSTINLKFTDFSIENHPHCRYDYVIIRDGDSQLAPVLGKFCGNVIPNNIVSSRNKLWIRFYSDSAVNGNGFIANFTQVNSSSESNQFKSIPTPTPEGPCGGHLTGTSGEIVNPRFHQQYNDWLRCVWLIDNDNPYDVIQVNFELLRINKNQGCLFDYVMIEDLSEDTEKNLGRFCGTALPSRISGQRLRITYQTEECTNNVGFKIRWEKVGKNILGTESQACGGAEVSTTGFLRSNNYPENYQNNLNCQWSLSAPKESMKIQLRFSSFDLEKSTNCEYDSLQIYDGPNTKSPLLGRYCGWHIPHLIETTQKHIFIVFETDGSDTASGFEALWVAVANSDYKASNRLPRQPKSTGDCGGVLEASNGTITTPNYPSKYPSNSDCTWIIRAESDYQIKFMFKNFELEKHENCIYDKVSIRDGESATSKIIFEGCGDSLPGEVVSKSEALWIQFHSDNSKELTGFLAKWQFVSKSGQKGCGTVFKTKVGELSSPDYPNAAKGKNFCTWTIEAPADSKIEVTFKDINMRSSASCLYGYVQVFDGDAIDSPELGRFCQEFLPRPMISSGSKVIIGFEPDNTASSRGFKLEWKTVSERQAREKPVISSATPCNSTLRAEFGRIVLRKGIRSCKWLIKPSTGKRITISVIKANLIPNPDCSLERLYIRNGYTSTAPLLLKICERMQGTNAISFTNVLRIEYELIGESNEQEVVLQWSALREKGDSKPLAASCGATKESLSKYLFTIATPGMLPWMAALHNGPGVVYCGAAIISSKWLVTAAHCLKRYPINAFRKIAIGNLNSYETEASERRYDIKLLHIHPEYNASTNENDIALIKIDGEIVFTENLSAICLPNNDTYIPDGRWCFSAGWGTRSFLGLPSNRLVMGAIPIVSSSRCNSTRVYRGKIMNGMLCAGSDSGGIDTCQGDGGGPLVCEISNKRYVLSGVSSWGNGCGLPGRYGVYTDVRKYLDWISSIAST